ncbi:MAG: phage tail protein [Mitsuokella sp.]
MIQIVIVENPFEMKKEVRSACYNQGNICAYVDVAARDVFLNGAIVEDVEHTYPQDGSQLIVMPHIEGGALKSILGFVAMIALSLYAGGIAGGLWKGALGSAFAGGTVGATLASGAVMFLGGKIINSIFPQQMPKMSWNEQETSRSYGWDIPTPTTIAGQIVGETYGECLPAAQLLEAHVETVGDKQYLNLLYCGGYGPVDSIDSIRIDHTDISVFNGVEMETRFGTNDQKPISFFKNTPLDQSVGVELVQGTSVVRTSNSKRASALEVTLEWPGGLYHINDSGGYDNATVKFILEYRKGKEDSWHNFNPKSSAGYAYSVTMATSEAVRRTFSVEGLEPGQYDVQVTLTDRPTTTRYQTLTQWTIMTSYTDGVYSRPNKVLVALRILATNQLSSGIPSVNWRQKRNTVYVWDPTKKTYIEKAADNPIWAAYDILHHCRRLRNIHTDKYEFIADGVAKESLAAYWEEWESAAAYADEEILNQDGKKEPRFRFDAIFDVTQKRMTAAQKAANIGHAVIIPHGRNYGIVVDRPGVMTQIFGEGRTTVSTVKGTFSSKEDRARAIEVTYNDGENDFKNSVMTIRSPNYNKDNTWTDNTAPLSLFGVKRRSQAYREAITALATNERQVQTVTLSADIDAIVAEYGDIVGFNHAASRIGIASGRIVAATSSTVTLDREVEISAARTYEIYIQTASDQLIKRKVAARDYKGDTLLVETPFDDGHIPELHDNYAFGETNKVVKPFRIVSAARNGDMLVDLTLAEYDEAMYATELDYAKYPMVDYTDNSTTAAVLAVVATEKSYEVGDAVAVDIFVEWTMRRSGRKPDGYMVELSGRSGDYSNQARTEKTSCTFHNVKPGETYDIAVKCVFGEITIGSAATVIKASASTKMPTVKPDKPQKLNIVIARHSVKAFWNEVTNTYIACYELRTNTAAGTPDGLLFQTKDVQATLELNERKDTIYLFAKNRIGQYSDPAEIAYEKPAPPAPKWVNAVARIGEIAITTESIPSDCLGVVVRAKGAKAEEKVVKSESPDILIAAEADIYAVRVTFYDQFGEGAEASAPREVAVKDKIDKGAIENLTVTQNDLDTALKKQLSDMQTTANAANTAAGDAANAAGAAQTMASNAVARVQQAQDSISSIVARLSGNPQNSGYSAITQLYNGLQLKVNQGDVASAINVAPWGVRIDGRLLHITGATQFDGNIIANHMLQARAVTADKLDVGSLSAISADIGLLRTRTSGERVEMENNQIRVYDANNRLRVRMGVW